MKLKNTRYEVCLIILFIFRPKHFFSDGYSISSPEILHKRNYAYVKSVLMLLDFNPYWKVSINFSKIPQYQIPFKFFQQFWGC
jgi:hypothetical protein